MIFPQSLFSPILKARKTETSPIIRSLRRGLGRLCESRLDPMSPGYIDYETRANELWTTRAPWTSPPS